MSRPVRMAVVAGPQYDHSSDLLDKAAEAAGVPIAIGFRGAHSELNLHLREQLPAGSFDVISTHGKYVASQATWLRGIGDIVDVDAFHATAVRLCSFGGDLLCAPRCIDVRLLWGRRDLVGDALPVTWEALLATASEVTTGDIAGFTFPGRGSGLFGTFAELAAAFGDHLFDEDEPRFLTFGAAAAVNFLYEAHVHRRVTPEGLLEGGYDEVARDLREGRVALAGDWPAYFAALTSSPLRASLAVGRYPAGPARRAAYAGCHGWAITRNCQDVPAAAAVVECLTSQDAAAVDAASGMVPARIDVPLPVVDELGRRRATLLAETIKEDLMTFPSLPHFPDLEDAGAELLRRALRGEITPSSAMEQLQRVAERTP